MPTSPTWELILAERRRQIEVEGWTADHDAQHDPDDLAIVAACYVAALDHGPALPPGEWPWDLQWWKPKDRLRNLVRAGALYLAARDLAKRRGAQKSADTFHAQAVRVAEVIDQEFPETPQA